MVREDTSVASLSEGPVGTSEQISAVTQNVQGAIQEIQGLDSQNESGILAEEKQSFGSRVVASFAHSRKDLAEFYEGFRSEARNTFGEKHGEKIALAVFGLLLTAFFGVGGFTYYMKASNEASDELTQKSTKHETSSPLEEAPSSKTSGTKRQYTRNTKPASSEPSVTVSGISIPEENRVYNPEVGDALGVKVPTEPGHVKINSGGAVITGTMTAGDKQELVNAIRAMNKMK